jgi:hypothetical protein
VIDWGKSPLAWYQWLKEKEVIDVFVEYVREFPGYLDVVLRYNELVAIIENPVQPATSAWLSDCSQLIRISG